MGQDGAPVKHEGMAEQIGRMAEESRQQAQGQAQGQVQAQDKSEEKTRADGTKLQERGDIPKNPKKKMFEADVEDAKYEEQQRPRDEL